MHENGRGCIEKCTSATDFVRFRLDGCHHINSLKFRSLHKNNPYEMMRRTTLIGRWLHSLARPNPTRTSLAQSSLPKDSRETSTRSASRKNSRSINSSANPVTASAPRPRVPQSETPKNRVTTTIFRF